MSVGDPLAYRLRVRLHVDLAGHVGFFGRNSREVVPASECLVVAPELRVPLRALASLTAAERATLGASFAALDLRAVPGDGSVELELEPRDDVATNERNVQALLELLGKSARVSLATRRRSGLRRYELPGGGFLRVSSGGFTQVNWVVNAALVARVIAGVQQRGAKSFLDLYAGVGNFSVPFARAGLRGAAVEVEAGSIAALREALREQSLSGIELVTGDVARTLPRLSRKYRGVDLVLLDPPRAGAKDALEPLLLLEPKTIAYVACDPVTLARDLKLLVAGGFALEAVQGFDMFPQTHHVETLVWLGRTSRTKA